VVFEPPSAHVAVEVVVTVFVKVVVFAPPMATKRLAEISTPAMTIAEAITR
jgi:hypothetical protein